MQPALEMRLAFRFASSATSRLPSLLQTGQAVSPAVFLSYRKQICTRLSSTESKSAAKGTVKNAPSPLPSPPPPPKSMPPTITTPDIEEYVQPLYLRGWGLCPILPNGNGIAVLRKRFDFASARSLKQFLADLDEYEEKEQVRSVQLTIPDNDTNSLLFFISSSPFVFNCRMLSITQRRMCLRINVLF